MLSLKKINTILLINLVVAFSAQAQQNYFVYFQADEKQPFYVMLNNKVYSSSETGYLIIPKITPGVHAIRLGFALNKFPEQSFSIQVKNNDEGYMVKNFGAKGWGLVDFNSSDVVLSETNQPAQNNNAAFGNMLSEVVDDTELTKVSRSSTEEVIGKNTNQDMEAASQVEIKTPAATTIEQQHANKSEVIAATENVPKVDMVKSYEKSENEGMRAVFVDNTMPGSDTINVFIPKNVPAAKEDNSQKNRKIEKEIVKNDPSFLENSTVNIQKEVDENTNPFFKPQANEEGMDKEDNYAETVTQNTDENIIRETVVNPFRSECNDVISENELDRIKRKMLGKVNEEDMINTVQKLIAGKCLTTDQVKTLGVQLQSDEGRYNLYDVLYTHVKDYKNYTALESQIIDPYYKKRFTTLLMR